jgi:hypothetical protein
LPGKAECSRTAPDEFHSKETHPHTEDNLRLALDIAQAPARKAVYTEKTPIFVPIAEGLGIRSILHTDYRSMCAKLASFGLQNDERVIDAEKVEELHRLSPIEKEHDHENKQN